MNLKFYYLEGLRGVAALIVVFSHFVVAFYPALYNGNPTEIHTSKGLELWIAKTPMNIIYNGNFAVCIFFVLSGYVLTYRFFTEKKVELMSSQAARRYVRLTIPILFSVLIVYIGMKLSLFYNVKASNISYSDWWLGTFWNFETSILDVLKFSLYDVLFTMNNKYNTVLWTMHYEFLGSFLVYAVAAIFGKLRNRFIYYIILMVIFIKTYYLAFILGLIIADLYHSNSKLRVTVSNFKSINLILILLLAASLFLGSLPTGIELQTTSIYKGFDLSFVNAHFFTIS